MLTLVVLPEMRFPRRCVTLNTDREFSGPDKVNSGLLGAKLDCSGVVYADAGEASSLDFAATVEEAGVLVSIMELVGASKLPLRSEGWNST